MAILKSLIARKAKQKLAGMALYELNGQTVARELAATVTNPRTQAQMAQRMRLSNMVQFWKKSRPWSKHGAFENKKSTWSDYNAFVSANMGVSAPYLTKEQVAQGACVLAPYTISRGSLPVVATKYVADGAEFVSNIYFTNEPNAVDATLGSLSRDVIANNNGIQNGDQISLVEYIQQVQNGVPYVVCRYFELTLNVNADSTPVPDDWKKFCLAGDGIYAFSHAQDGQTCAAAYILSRKVGGKILVSTQALVLNPAAQSFSGIYQGVQRFTEVVYTYGEETTNFLDPATTRGGSDGDVPLSVTLLSVSVNGNTYTNGFVPFVMDQGDDVVFNFSGDLSGATLGEVEAIGLQSGTTHESGFTISGNTVVGAWPDAAYEGESNRVKQLIVVINDVAYELTGQNVGGGDSEPGDVIP